MNSEHSEHTNFVIFSDDLETPKPGRCHKFSLNKSSFHSFIINTTRAESK